VRNFAAGAAGVAAAIAGYRSAVLSGEFPAPEHGFD